MADNEEPDYIFLECNCDHSFEKTDDNSRWINKIDGGVTLPENSTLSVQYAGINVLGSGGDVIEFKHEKVGESEIYKYNTSTSEYDKIKYEVYDNEATLQLEFYKNQDGLYNYLLPMPEFNYDSTANELYWSALDNTKGADEIQYGIDTSTFKSNFNYAFPIDNKRYTILERDPNSEYTNPDIVGRQYDGLDFHREISDFEYFIYHNEVNISVDKGFISPSSVAEQISQQLDKHTEPKIKEMRCWANNLDYSQQWDTRYEDIKGGLTCETNTFKLFKCATRRTYYLYASLEFNDTTTLNNHSEVIQYQKNFHHIGCYNPNIFLTGRLIRKDLSYQNRQEPFLILSNPDLTGITDPQIIVYELFTNIPYDKNLLSQFNNLFKFIRNDNEMYETKVAKLTESTAQNSVFLHTEPKVVTYADLTAYKRFPFGLDFTTTSAVNLAWTNPIYLEWDSTEDQGFSNNGAYGVFKPWRANDGTIYSSIRARLYVDMNTDVTPNTPYFPYYNIKTRQTFGSELAEGYQAFSQSSFPIATNSYTRIGWDRHFSAHGNQCILLWNGLMDKSELRVQAQPKSGQLHSNLQVFENSFIKTGTEGDETPEVYYYDTGNDEIYLGADSFLFNFDNTESRFTISQLHTSRKQFNTALSGFDDSVWQGVEVDTSTGNPKIFYLSNFVNGNNDVQFPLNANPNSNQAIYEISPTPLNTHTQEVANAFQDLKINTVFDSNCGIYFGSFGVDDKTYKNSLWDILGFSKAQTKTYMTETPDLQVVLYRNNRFLNSGVNLGQSQIYPFTTNAQINSNEIISWKTNPFNLSYFNTLGIPNNMRVLTKENTHNFIYEQKVRPYQVIQNQVSTLMFGERLPRKTDIPFYQVRSDILPTIKYFGGNNQTSGKLPVLSLVNKSFSGTDYYVNQGDNSMEFIITKRITINNITTEIYDSNGRPALLDPHSSVIYKVQVPYNPPQITPFSTSLEYTTAMNMEKQKQKKNKK
jgi:hypothetical protein